MKLLREQNSHRQFATYIPLTWGWFSAARDAREDIKISGPSSNLHTGPPNTARLVLLFYRNQVFFFSSPDFPRTKITTTLSLS